MIGQLAGLLLIVRRSLRQHALSTVVTVLSVALGCGLVMAVFSANAQSVEAFTGGEVGFDAVLGARGSQLQLVLNTVFHLETSPGNLKWELYEKIAEDPRVELAIPYALGDNYKGFRIVGTTPELFTELDLEPAHSFRLRPAGAGEHKGKLFTPGTYEALVGSTVADRLGLGVGDRINPYHGIVYAEDARHDEEYLVVGVLEPTNSPSDRVIWIPIEGVFRMSDHVLRGGGENYVAAKGVEIPDEHKEVSAVMLKLRGGARGGMALDQLVNRQGNVATLAWPIAKVMTELFAKIGWMSKVLEVVSYLVVLVAAGSILASITNSMNERRREFAILRSLGARRRTVFSVIVLEAGAIALLGALVGFVVYGVIFVAAMTVIRAQTGVVLDPLVYHPAMALTPVGMVLLGSLAGLLPAWKAYRTDVAENLSPTS